MKEERKKKDDGKKFIVEGFKFNENTMQFEHYKTFFFYTKESLLDFIEFTMAYAGKDYLWRITTSQEV